MVHEKLFVLLSQLFSKSEIILIVKDSYYFKNYYYYYYLLWDQ